MARPLNERMIRVLRFLDRADKPQTPNEIGHALGFRPGDAKSANLPHQNTTRTMGVAVHVTTSLTALRKRGLVYITRRPDGLSGTAYEITEEGSKAWRATRA